MAKFITAKEAAELIPDHAIVGVGGMGLAGWPEEVGIAIRDRFKETGHPCDLNLKQGCAMGDWKTRGTTHLGEAGPGLVTRWSGAHVGSAFALRDLALENKLQCHCLPQGVIVNLWREIAAGKPGLLTKVGLGTFVDPRVQGGKMNEPATDDLVEVVNFQGEEYLFYKGFKPNVALLRGTTADENGNITFEHESFINEGMMIAMAVKNSGGIVIVQVEYVRKNGQMKPKDVKIPGILVDYVVQATTTDACWQTEGLYYDPSFSGEIQKPLAAIENLPFNERKIINRRCAMELKKGDVINLGVGIPADLAKIVNEEPGVDIDDFTMSTESGMIGGVPSALPHFGAAYNAQACIDHGYMFDLIDGGGLNMTCLGLGEVDGDGNNNVSFLGKMMTGPGGFINITQATPKVIFCGTFMNKAKVVPHDGKLEIVEEGKTRKFVSKVKQITFAGQYAGENQTVLYITERAVFQLIDHKVTLIEIAPGIDLEKDILANMDFKPEISPNLKLMDERLFHEQWGGLADYIG
jgi:propionate CoA-transferase